MKKVRKIWGAEIWIINNDLYCGKILLLKKGFQCSLHYHINKTETFYVLSGKVYLEKNDERIVMERNKFVTLLPYDLHRFTGIEGSRIIEFSTYHEDSDTFRYDESRKISSQKFDQLFLNG